MQQIPILSNLMNYLTAPNLPQTSLSISETHLGMIALRKRGGEFIPSNLGVQRLPEGLIEASYTEPNIANETEFADLLAKTATQAGLDRVKKLSAALPANSTRSLVMTLDSVPDSRSELLQLIEWKVERSVGHKLSELRINHRRLSDFNGHPHWIVTTAHEVVISQYEKVFNQLRWQVGLIVPQYLGEAQWLVQSGIEDDQLVLSLRENGFDVVIIRGSEPILVRQVDCAAQEREDEFYRLMIFYRDRLLPEQSPVTLSRVLIIGNSADQKRFRDVLNSAIERNTVSLDPLQLGLRVDQNAPFNQFAAAGGLATMAWN